MKDQKYYNKIVSSGNIKKVTKILQTGDPQEKDMVFKALGAGAKINDSIYNQLVVIFHASTQKEDQLMAIDAMGMSGRSAAISQLERVLEQEKDPQIVEAIRCAIRTLRNN